MAFIPIKCPSCGGDIQIDTDREFGFCNYCGTKLQRDDVINLEVKVDKTKELKGMLTLAIDSLIGKDVKKGIENAEKAITADPDIKDTYYILAALCNENKEKSDLYLSRAEKSSIDLKLFSKDDYEKYKLYVVNFSLRDVSSGSYWHITIDDQNGQDFHYGRAIQFYSRAGEHTINVYQHWNNKLVSTIKGVINITTNNESYQGCRNKGLFSGGGFKIVKIN